VIIDAGQPADVITMSVGSARYVCKTSGAQQALCRPTWRMTTCPSTAAGVQGYRFRFGV